jgi:hypothetical protein
MNITRTAAIGVAAGMALLAAGCARPPASPVSSANAANAANTASAATSDYQKAVAYSQCMRAHGLPNFPDPDSKGRILITGSGPAGQSRADGPDSPAFRSADNSCKRLRPKGPSGSDRQQQAQQMLKFAQCMRAHGVPNFPDPIVSGGGIQIKLNGVNPNSPQFKSAQQACQSVVPGGAPPPPPGGSGNGSNSGQGIGSQP